MEFDTLIANGEIVDGTGRLRYSADVGITGDRIAAIGNLEDAVADRVIGRIRADCSARFHRHALALGQDAPGRPGRREQGVPGGYNRGRRELRHLPVPRGRDGQRGGGQVPRLIGRVGLDRPGRLGEQAGGERPEHQRRATGRPLGASVRGGPGRIPGAHPGRAGGDAEADGRVHRAGRVQHVHGSHHLSVDVRRHGRDRRTGGVILPVRRGVLREPTRGCGRATT